MRAPALARYRQALAEFQVELHRCIVDWAALDESGRGEFLAEYVLDDPDSRYAPSHAALLAAIQKVSPHHRYRLEWKVVDAWRTISLVRQGPAAPWEYARALVHIALIVGVPAVAGVFLLCLHGLMRGCEPLRLRRRDVVIGDAAVVCFLDITRRGMEERLVIDDAFSAGWLKEYSQRCFKGAPEDIAFPLSYRAVAHWMHKISDFLGAFGVGFTTHSLRRGGASLMLIQGTSVENICVAGRWVAVHSARLYLRRGEVFLHRLCEDLHEEVWRRMRAIASVSLAVWQLAAQVEEDASALQGDVAGDTTVLPPVKEKQSTRWFSVANHSAMFLPCKCASTSSTNSDSAIDVAHASPMRC